MTENLKTLIFGGTALLVVLIALFVKRPVASPVDAQEEVGALLYPAFKDPLAAGSLEIKSYDAVTATPKDFQVALVNNHWVIPSHESYPTDAEKQLPAAAASLLDLKILEIHSREKSAHEQYGVLDPDPEAKEIKSGSAGIGVKVFLDDKSKRPIMRLIIGKEDPSQGGVRFVRRAGKDAVYSAKIDTGKLSTRFEDWIEPDLLKVNGWDIASIQFDNYSVNETARSREDIIVQGDQLALAYDDSAEKKWSLAGLQEGEELNQARLDEVRDALDDLRIVDVRHKPPALIEGLKSQGGIRIDRETEVSLAEKGFYVIEGVLVSNEGDVVVGTKEGIEYVLRFGEIAADAVTATAGDESKPKGQNRYVFISAQFNKDRIEPPQLQRLPGEEPAAQPATETPAAEDEAPAAPEPEAPKPDANEATTETPAGATCQPASAEADTAPPAEAQPTDPSADAAAKSPDEIAVEAERQRIEMENKRLQGLYDQKVKDGEKKAEELNARFADWYYVISDEIYRKIKVTRADIIQGVDPLSGEKNTLEEFEQLKNALPPMPPVQESAPAEGGEADKEPTTDAKQE